MLFTLLKLFSLMLLYFEFSNKEVLLVNKTIIMVHYLRSFDNGGRDIGLTSISINKFNAKNPT